MVGVRSDDPHAVDFSPWNLWSCLDDLIWQLGGDIAQAADDGLTCNAQRTLGVPAFLSQIDKLGCRVNSLGQIRQKVVNSPGHRSTASARMCSSRGLRALRATTSTPKPRSSSRSWNKPT
jgi:hypothetical protein